MCLISSINGELCFNNRNTKSKRNRIGSDLLIEWPCFTLHGEKIETHRTVWCKI